MRATLLPIPRFLELAIQAADKSRYAGIAVVVDRQADRQSNLLGQLVDDRDSLDDVTASDILIVVPAPSGASADFNPRGVDSWVLDPRADFDDGYGTAGLLINADHGFANAFWGAAGDPNRHAEALRDVEWQAAFRTETLDMYTRLYGEDVKRQLEVAVTHAASETVRFLGLDESWVPCLTVLSLADRKLFVLRYGLLDELYGFFKAVVQRKPRKAGYAWLSHAVVSTAAELELKTDKLPEEPADALEGWTYVCYRCRSVQPIVFS